jgi:hypothetical protein
MKFLVSLSFLLASLASFAQNFPPQIHNLKASFSYVNDRMTITFDLSDSDNDSLEVCFLLSDDNGQTYHVDVSNAIGDLGYPVLPGTARKITWDAPMPISTAVHQVKIVASDREMIDIQTMVDQVDSTRLKEDLGWIEGVRTRTVGLSHLQAVKDSLENRFNALGLQASRQQQMDSGYLLENIIGKHSGAKEPGKVYIIDGHFDSVPNAPGADDNGTAVAGMLEAARILSQYTFMRSIHFIGFDQEETGLTGSLAYVNNLNPDETIEGVVNLEMIGYYDNNPNTQTLPAGFNLLFPDAYNAVISDSSRGNFITNVGNQNSITLASAFEQSSNTYVPDLRVITVISPGNGSLVPDLARSDHAAFWLGGIDALMITDGANFRNPYYHTPGDSIGTLNFAFMTQVVKASLATVAELAEPMNADEAVSGVEIDTSTTSIAPLLNTCDGWHILETEEAIVIDFSQSACIKGQSSLILTNMAGKQIDRITVNPNQQSLHIFRENYAKGIYLLTWRTRDGIASKKVLIR